MSDQDLVKVHNAKRVIIKIVKTHALGKYIGLITNGEGVVWIAYENAFFETYLSDVGIIATDCFEYESN